MSTAAQDLITEAKYDEDISQFFLTLNGCESPVCFGNVSIWDMKNAGDADVNQFTVRQIKEKQKAIGHFIAAAINEKIEREKGEREEPECEHLYDKVENGELKYWECRFCKHTIEFQK